MRALALALRQPEAFFTDKCDDPVAQLVLFRWAWHAAGVASRPDPARQLATMALPWSGHRAGAASRAILLQDAVLLCTCTSRRLLRQLLMAATNHATLPMVRYDLCLLCCLAVRQAPSDGRQRCGARLRRPHRLWLSHVCVPGRARHRGAKASSSIV